MEGGSLGEDCVGSSVKIGAVVVSIVGDMVGVSDGAAVPTV